MAKLKNLKDQIGKSKGLADIKAGKGDSHKGKHISGLKEMVGKSQGLKDVKNSKSQGDISSRMKNWL